MKEKLTKDDFLNFETLLNLEKQKDLLLKIYQMSTFTEKKTIHQGAKLDEWLAIGIKLLHKKKAIYYPIKIKEEFFNIYTKNKEEA